MTLALTQSKTALAPGLSASFAGVGGVEPYAYTVVAGGVGGTVGYADGLYTAPTTPASGKFYDTVTVTDYNNATATAQILVGSPLILFCDIIQRELGLANGRVYLWDQKIMQPTDSGLYVAVSVPTCKPFSNVNNLLAGGDQAQFVSMLATVDVDIISRGTEARDRKEEVVLAFNSVYAQRQQEANSFYIAKLPPGTRFVNISDVDGAAIPYRYRISVNLQYSFYKRSAADYFDNYQGPTIVTDP